MHAERDTFKVGKRQFVKEIESQDTGHIGDMIQFAKFVNAMLHTIHDLLFGADITLKGLRRSCCLRD